MLNYYRPLSLTASCMDWRPVECRQAISIQIQLLDAPLVTADKNLINAKVMNTIW